MRVGEVVVPGALGPTPAPLGFAWDESTSPAGRSRVWVGRYANSQDMFVIELRTKTGSRSPCRARGDGTPENTAPPRTSMLALVPALTHLTLAAVPVQPTQWKAFCTEKSAAIQNGTALHSWQYYDYPKRDKFAYVGVDQTDVCVCGGFLESS
jgi:hypothetical protein